MGAFGGNPYIAIEPPHQQLADLAGAPVRLLGLEADNQALDLLGELIGIAHRPPGPVAQGGRPVFFVAVENLVASLAGDAELPAVDTPADSHLLTDSPSTFSRPILDSGPGSFAYEYTVDCSERPFGQGFSFGP